MVQRLIKVPKHGGPDGQGLPEDAFFALKYLVSDSTVTDQQITDAIELCLSASKQQEWNDTYRPQLIDILNNNVIL